MVEIEKRKCANINDIVGLLRWEVFPRLYYPILVNDAVLILNMEEEDT